MNHPIISAYLAMSKGTSARDADWGALIVSARQAPLAASKRANAPWAWPAWTAYT